MQESVLENAALLIPSFFLVWQEILLLSSPAYSVLSTSFHLHQTIPNTPLLQKARFGLQMAIKILLAPIISITLFGK